MGGEYVKEVMVSSGVEYFKEGLNLWFFSSRDGGDPLESLRVFDGPINGAGLAVAADFTTCLAIGNIWVWDTLCTSADNGTTIVKPTRQLASIPGRWVKLLAAGGSGAGTILQIAGSPEGVVTAGLGSLCTDTTAPGVLYIKTTATGNTGWVINP